MITTPRFGAVYVAPEYFHDVKKLSEFGNPDYKDLIEEQPKEIHLRNNHLITGGLRATTGKKDLRVGSVWRSDGVLFNTDEADGVQVPGTEERQFDNKHPVLRDESQYTPDTVSENAITQVLKKAGIPFEVGSFRKLFDLHLRRPDELPHLTNTARFDKRV